MLAYHEARHAVVGHVLGRTLHAVAATQHCEFEPLPNKWTETDIENSAKIALAGPHAEVSASKEKVSVLGGMDVPQAKDHAKELAGANWKERLEELSIASQALVLENWKKIESLAQRLIKIEKAVGEKELTVILEKDV